MQGPVEYSLRRVDLHFVAPLTPHTFPKSSQYICLEANDKNVIPLFGIDTRERLRAFTDKLSP